ncbi:MAG: YSC84-related protein [Gammaproteobacteria bacterium]
MMSRHSLLFGVTLVVLSMLATPSLAVAKSAEQIEIESDAALETFKKEVKGGAAFLEKAKGVLIIPEIYKGGVGLGFEYGEGALRIDGKTVDYYSSMSGSIGLQLGLQKRSVLIAFMEQPALDQFRASSGWKAGVDGSVALVEWGSGASLDSVKIKDPIVGFIFSNEGLMFNLSLEGSKFTKLVR